MSILNLKPEETGAGKLRLTAVSVTSMERNKHATVFVMAWTDEKGAVHIDSDLFCRIKQKYGFGSQELCRHN